MWYHLSLYVEKCLPLFLDREIMQNVVVLADIIRHEQLLILKGLCFSKIYQFNLIVRLLPKWLSEQFKDKYVFGQVSWNYLEIAIPRFLSKHLGLHNFIKKPKTLFLVKEILVRNSNNGQWERHKLSYLMENFAFVEIMY